MNIKWYKINEDDLQYMLDQGCDYGDYEGDSFLIVTTWDIVDSLQFKQYFNDSDNWGFNDEYSSCGECYQNIIRISPDSYGWQPKFYFDPDYGYICSECAQDYIDQAIQEIQDRIDNNDQPKSFPVIFNIDDSWHKIDVPGYPNSSWQNGMHHGMNDDPLRQGKIVRSHKLNGESILQIIFRVYPSQFNIDWDSYIRVDPDSDIKLSNEDIEILIKDFSKRFNSPDGRFPYDQATLYEKALKNIKYPYSSIKVDPENGTIDITGTNNINEYFGDKLK